MDLENQVLPTFQLLPSSICCPSLHTQSTQCSPQREGGRMVMQLKGHPINCPCPLTPDANEETREEEEEEKEEGEKEEDGWKYLSWVQAASPYGEIKQQH